MLLQGRLTYYAVYIPTMLLCVFYLLTFAWLIPYRVRMNLATLWPAFMSMAWLRIGAGINVEVKGLENLPKEPFVAVSNHQSEWETLYLSRLLYPSSVVLKKALLKLPIYGWGIRLIRPIAVDRSSPRSSIKTILQQGRKRLMEGSNVLIFPEGTRVTAGSICRYARTAFKLSVESSVPLVPIVHNSGNCWRRRTFQKGTIQIVIGTPINTEKIEANELSKCVERWTYETFNSLKSKKKKQGQALYRRNKRNKDRHSKNRTEFNR